MSNFIILGSVGLPTNIPEGLKWIETQYGECGSNWLPDSFSRIDSYGGIEWSHYDNLIISDEGTYNHYMLVKERKDIQMRDVIAFNEAYEALLHTVDWKAGVLCNPNTEYKQVVYSPVDLLHVHKGDGMGYSDIRCQGVLDDESQSFVFYIPANNIFMVDMPLSCLTFDVLTVLKHFEVYLTEGCKHE